MLMSIIFWVLVVLIFGMIIAMIRYYSDNKESHWLTTSVSVLGISLALVYISFIPFDIYLTSSGLDLFQPPLMPFAINIKTVYSVLCLVMILFWIWVIPFSYFYIQEGVDEDYSDSEFSAAYHRDYIDDIDESEELSYFQKLIRTIQHTFLFVVCWMITVIVWYFIFTYNATVDIERERWKMFESLQLDTFVRLALSLFLIIGSAIKALYSSYGLSAFAFFLIKGQKSMSQEKKEIKRSIAQVREQYRSLQEKYARGTKKRKTMSDVRLMKQLKTEERKLRLESTQIEYQLQKAENKDFFSRILNFIFNVLAPFRITVGFVCLSISLAIVGSLACGNINRMIYSKCGFSCGYQVIGQNVDDDHKIINSMINLYDSIFVQLSNFFPIDLIIFLLILANFFISTLFAISKIGIRLLFISIYRIKRDRTYPQAICSMALFMILIMFSFTFDLSTLMPRYLTYAAQTDVTKHMSKISQFNTAVLIKNNLFSCITFIMSNVFIAFYAIFFFYHMMHNKDSQFIINWCWCAKEEEYSDDEENQGVSFGVIGACRLGICGSGCVIEDR